MDTIISKEDPILQSPPATSSARSSTSAVSNKKPRSRTPASKIPKYTSSTTPVNPRRKKESLLKEASSFCSKGCSEWKSKRSESAKSAFTSALLILEPVLGTYHLLTAKTYFWIGFILQKSTGEKKYNDYQRCLEAFSMALRIRLRMCGSNHKSTEEARQAVRWAFRKLVESSNDERQESIQDFLMSIEKSLRYEARGDKKVTAKDYQSALVAFEKAFQTATQWEQYARPTPQLMFKLGDCYLSLDETQNAIFWFRRALLDIYLNSFHHHQQHPVVHTVYEKLKKLVPTEAIEDYIQMVESSMHHIKSSQEMTGWSSQEELLEAIRLELLYADSSKDPFVKYLVNQINHRDLRTELSSQVQLADDGILQLALSFNRKDTNATKTLEQLDAFQKRATSCLQIAEEYIGETSVPSNGILTESWNGQEAKWLSRQVQVMELLQLHVSDVQGKSVKKSTTSKQSDRVDFLTQELAKLSMDLTEIQEKLNSSPSKLKKGDRESLISQMADQQQGIAFREGQLEMEQQSSEDGSFSCDGVEHSSESLLTLRRCLAQGKEAISDLGQIEKSDEEDTPGDKSSFWNDSFEAGLWKHPMDSNTDESPSSEIVSSRQSRQLSLNTNLASVTERLTIQTDQNDHFDSYFSPKTMEETETAVSSQAKLDNALREAEDLRQQKERNNKELQNARSAMESCERMANQYNSAPVTEKTYLIKNLVAASRQEVDYYSRKDKTLDEKLHVVQSQITALLQRLQSSGGESTYDASQKSQEVSSIKLQEESDCAASLSQMESFERPRVKTGKQELQRPLLGNAEVETQGVLSHAPSVHRSLASAMQQLDSSMDKKLEKSFLGIDRFLLNPGAPASDLTSTFQTVRNQAMRRLDGYYSEMQAEVAGRLDPAAQNNTTLPPMQTDSSTTIAEKTKGPISQTNVVCIADIRRRIRQHRFTFHSTSGTFIMRRPSIDCDKWDNEVDAPVSKEYNATVVYPETIDVMVQIKCDGSMLLLTSDSVVQHRVKGGKWKNLGAIDKRDTPFGWIRYTNGGARCKTNYSLDEILEEAIVLRSRYCDLIANPNLSLFDVIVYNGQIRICVILSMLLVLGLVIRTTCQFEAYVGPFIGL
ncbi:unnamed protein product [Cylindrotheca closterium]|uniref:Uncharacterized protein n=1 Tax=Cylindrotheca closterium TaxID=2856 RepID=A0AAD2JPW1_9STRA|nr:unnamed protein product [Cylindrotheca closterium]